MILALGTYYPGLRVNSLDLSPNYSGSLMALTNGVAAIAGIIVPTFIGMMTPDVCYKLIFILQIVS